MAQVIWSEPALSDLNDIADYIALDNIDAARNFVQLVFSGVERLQKHPNSGRKPPELVDFRCREIIIGPCRVFYRHTKKTVYILYVMRSERQLRSYVLDNRNTGGS